MTSEVGKLPELPDLYCINQQLAIQVTKKIAPFRHVLTNDQLNSYRVTTH